MLSIAEIKIGVNEAKSPGKDFLSLPSRSDEMITSFNAMIINTINTYNTHNTIEYIQYNTHFYQYYIII